MSLCKYIQLLHWQVREVPEQETSMVLWPAKHSCLSLGWDSDRSRWHSLSWDERISRSYSWFAYKRRSSLGPLQRAGFGPLARLVLCCSAHFSGGGSSSWGLRKHSLRILWGTLKSRSYFEALLNPFLPGVLLFLGRCLGDVCFTLSGSLASFLTCECDAPIPLSLKKAFSPALETSSSPLALSPSQPPWPGTHAFEELARVFLKPN